MRHLAMLLHWILKKLPPVQHKAGIVVQVEPWPFPAKRKTAVKKATCAAKKATCAAKKATTPKNEPAKKAATKKKKAS
jgi:hypothetical protein